MAPCESITKEALLNWSHHKISFPDSEGSITHQMISTTCTIFCGVNVAFPNEIVFKTNLGKCFNLQLSFLPS